MQSLLMQGCRQGGAGGASAPTIFDRSVNPISTRGGRLCPPQYYQPSRIFRPCDGPVMYSVVQKNFVFVRDLFFRNSYNLLQRANQAFTMHSAVYLAFFNIMQYNYAWTTTFVYSPRIMSLQRNR